MKWIGSGIAKWIVRRFERGTLSTTSAQLSSPQMLGEDMDILSGIFPGKVISVDNGKIVKLGLGSRPVL